MTTTTTAPPARPFFCGPTATRITSCTRQRFLDVCYGLGYSLILDGPTGFYLQHPYANGTRSLWVGWELDGGFWVEVIRADDA